MVTLVLAGALALVAALRSTWSPCGVSMLSTITPLAERSRGRRYGATSGWFVTGSLLGGLALGVVAAAGAAIVRSWSPGRTVLAVVAVLGSLAAATFDAGLARPALPHHRRQVNELWLDRYRGWVYGVGFGAQIGFGLATFIMTGAVYLTVLLGALSGRPLLALGVGGLFGLGRGVAVLAGRRLTSPEALRRFHQRFEAWRGPVAQLTLLAELLSALVLAATIGPAAIVAVFAATAAGTLTLRVRRGEPPAAPGAPCSVPTGPGSTAGAR